MVEVKRRIFGTDGVRGRTNRSPMDSEMALQLGRSAAYVLKNGPHRHRIVIGKDTRLSGYMLESALASGITSMGTDVLLVGPLPTPGVAFITRSMRADAGVVISGSHNDYRDNGIKFFDRDGFKLADSLEEKFEDAIFCGEAEKARVEADQIGRAFRVEDARGRYIQFLKSVIPSKLTLDGLKIVVDCSHGAGYRIAPFVLEELGADVVAIGDRPDGTNINKNCGSLHPEKLCETICRHGANAGFALDGDADRVIMCDEKGEIVDGDVIMGLCAVHFAEKGCLARQTLVATVMSNLALDHALKKRGIAVIRTAVGDRYVIDAMRQGSYNLGGEKSGHLIFLDHNTTGDGILGALQVLGIMVASQRPLSELKKVVKLYPQVLLNVPVSSRPDLVGIPRIAQALSDAEGTLQGRGRILVRYSGTEPIARVMVEGEDSVQIEKMANQISGVIRESIGVSN